MAALPDEPVLPADFFKAQPWSFADFHDMLEIGKGKDTVIYSAACPKLGNKRVAVKMYDKHKVQPTKYRAIKREIAMMMYFTNKRLPFCCEYYGAFHDADHIYVIMEYCAGGDLLEKLLKDKKAMNEKKVAIEVAIPMLTILKQLHAMKIIHRDIKLENIFIDDAGRVKLGDFGLTMSMKQESAISPVGTVEYMAPEVVALPPVDLVVSGQVKAQDIPPTNEKVDIWALGVTLYELVTGKEAASLARSMAKSHSKGLAALCVQLLQPGRLPFEGKDKPEIKRNITANNLAGFPSFLTPQCQSMIRAMLTYNAAERPSAEALLAHPYITMYSPSLKPGLFANVISLQAFTPGAGAAEQGQGSARGALAAAGVTTAAQGHASGSGPGNGFSSNSNSGRLRPGSSGQITYRDALAGVAAAGEPCSTPRTPGGTTVGFNVHKGRAATSMATPMAAHGVVGAFHPGNGDWSSHGGHSRPASPSKANSSPFSPSRLGDGQGFHGAGMDDGGRLDDPARRAHSWSSAKGYQGVSSPERSNGSVVQGLKTTLKKLFTRRSTHQRLEDMQSDSLSQPASPITSFTQPTSVQPL